MHSYKFENIFLTDIEIDVPLNWDEDTPGTKIKIFARIVARDENDKRPYLLYLQGGPGFESPRPAGSANPVVWLPIALERYRVIFLDQRGTGLSSPIGDADLQEGAVALAKRLTYYRADSIVRDCEALRQTLGVENWSILGQSFGGFTILNYLSHYPQSVKEAFFTGGLSAIGHTIEEVYRTCYEKMRQASEAYYARFTHHRSKMRQLAELATNGEIVLPNQEILSLSRLRSLGHLLGSDHGWFSLYKLLEIDPKSNAFRYDLQALLPFSPRNPLYYVIHEACYADGQKTAWAAARVLPEAFQQDPTLLTGEHIDPSWAQTVPGWQPWAEVANLISEVHWTRLYDPQTLKDADITGAGAIYFHDRYVPLEYSIETAELLGIKTFITSEHEHSGIHSSGGKVLSHLFEIVDGSRVR